MSNPSPERFENVTVVCKANVYFDGRVVSHSILFANGSKKTIGLIFPGSFQFNTGAAEKMEIVAGQCRVRLAGDADWKIFAAGTSFNVPGQSSFEVAVEGEIAEYVCSFE